MIAVGVSGAAAPAPDSEGLVRVANLVYGRNKTSVCFSSRFLEQIARETTIKAHRKFAPVKLESPDLFKFPFAIMTGEGRFRLTDGQRSNLRGFLQRGGFLLASSGCSSPEWDASFRAEMRRVLPDRKLGKLEMTHPVFHTVYDIKKLRIKRRARADSHLKSLVIDGRIVLIYSALGLNDTRHAGSGCCCCGGNEILNAQSINVNILAYALTH